MSFNNYLEEKLLNWLFCNGAFTPPAVHVGLSRADPAEDGSGLDEPSGNGYDRVTTAYTDWDSWAAGTVDNGNAITFPQATGDSWGTVTHFALFDDSVGGNMLAYGSLSVARAIAAGDTARFAAGDLDVTLD